MKEKFRKFSSFAIIGILMFSGCLGIGTEEAIGTNSNPQAVVEVTALIAICLASLLVAILKLLQLLYNYCY